MKLLARIEENALCDFKVFQQMDSTFNQSIKYFSNITIQTIDVLSSINEFEIHCTNFLSGVTSLMNGYLSHYLIPRYSLISTLNHVSDVLQAQGSQWRMISENPKFYYQYGCFISIRDNSSLYITVQVPVTYTDHAYDVYEVLVFPLPTHDNGGHVTKLVNTPIAILLM